MIRRLKHQRYAGVPRNGLADCSECAKESGNAEVAWLHREPPRLQPCQLKQIVNGLRQLLRRGLDEPNLLLLLLGQVASVCCSSKWVSRRMELTGVPNSCPVVRRNQSLNWLARRN